MIQLKLNGYNRIDKVYLVDALSLGFSEITRNYDCSDCETCKFQKVCRDIHNAIAFIENQQDMHS